MATGAAPDLLVATLFVVVGLVRGSGSVDGVRRWADQLLNQGWQDTCLVALAMIGDAPWCEIAGPLRRALAASGFPCQDERASRASARALLGGCLAQDLLTPADVLNMVLEVGMSERPSASGCDGSSDDVWLREEAPLLLYQDPCGRELKNLLLSVLEVDLARLGRAGRSVPG